MSSERSQRPHPSDVLVVTRRIRIPTSEFRFTFARSSGPGGQNVNKVNTKAQLRWPIVDSPSLSDDVKQRFLDRYRRRITAEGDLLVTSQRYRDQVKNVADCLEKLKTMLTEVAIPPKPRKTTKPSKSARERRLQEKKERSRKKQRRRPPELGD